MIALFAAERLAPGAEQWAADHAVIRHIGHRLEDSLVGSGATVTRDFAFPSGLRLRVGRRAEVLLA